MIELLVIDSTANSTPYVNERRASTIADSETLSCIWEKPLSGIARLNLNGCDKKELDKNWKLDEYFPLIYVINLSHATERLQKTTEELQAIGVSNFEVFPAINGRKDLPASIWKKFHLNLHDIDTSTSEGKIAINLLHQGQAGCYMSHYKLVQQVDKDFKAAQKRLKRAIEEQDLQAIEQAQIKVRKYSRVLILEDDIGFGYLDNSDYTISKKSVGVSLSKAFSKLPDDWDILYLIVNPTNPTSRVSNRLRKIDTSWSFAAYALRYTMYQPFLNKLKKIEDPRVTKISPVDSEISQIQYRHNVYAVCPSVVYSYGGKSQITGLTWLPWQGQPFLP